MRPPGMPPQGGYGGYPPPNGPPTGPITTGYPIGGLPPEPRRRGSGGLVVGVAVLALVIGGLAGGLGGYLVSHNDNDVASSLTQPEPANQTANAPAGSVQAVASKVLPVVVTIAAEFQAQGDVNGDTGSGFIISSNGDILTNNHVIADAASGGRIQVIFASGKTVDATVVGRDPTTDIAVIKAQGVSGLPIAALGRSDDLAVGQDVVAIGAPFELSGTVTSGIVSSLHRPTEAGDGTDTSQTTVLDAIQTDAPINPGNSGGPLVDMQGHVIGINSAIYSPQSSSGGLQGQQTQGGNVGIGFAIPIDQARRTADEIVKTGKATQTVLGVQVTDNTPTEGGQASILPNGALIKSVTSGGPADKAGLKAGAVGVKADGRTVNSSDGLVAAVHAAAPGDRMTLTLSNGATVTVTLSGQPVNPN
jgi:putative serine protease PepD